MVKVPVLELPLGFAATAYATVPLPLPLLPEVIVIQATLLLAVQAQPDAVVTFSVPVVALAATDWLVDERE